MSFLTKQIATRIEHHTTIQEIFLIVTCRQRSRKEWMPFLRWIGSFSLSGRKMRSKVLVGIARLWEDCARTVMLCFESLLLGYWHSKKNCVACAGHRFTTKFLMERSKQTEGEYSPLAENLVVHHSTGARHLARIDKARKMLKWVLMSCRWAPSGCFDTYSNLLVRFKNNPFTSRIITVYKNGSSTTTGNRNLSG